MPTDVGLWVDWRPASFIPPSSMLFFGAQVGHDRQREDQAMATCRQCGGLLVEALAADGLADDPLIDFDDKSLGESVWVCGSCMRSHYDEQLSLRKYSTAQTDERTNRNRVEHDAHKVEGGCDCSLPGRERPVGAWRGKSFAELKSHRKAKVRAKAKRS